MALSIARAHKSVGLLRRGGNISVDFSFLFYFIIQTSWTNLNSMIQKKLIFLLTIKMFFNQQNHLTFHSEERLANLVRGRECLCWPIYIISLCLIPALCGSLSYLWACCPAAVSALPVRVTRGPVQSVLWFCGVQQHLPFNNKINTNYTNSIIILSYCTQM